MWDLQRFVYAIEVGGLRKVLLGGAVLAIMLGLAAFYSVSQFNGLDTAEAMDQAQLGRNLAEGRGFKTWCIRPLAIWQMRDKGIPDKQIDLLSFPDTINPPGYPMLLGLIFKVAHPKFAYTAKEVQSYSIYAGDRLINLTGIACTLIAGILLFVWVLRMFDLLAAITSIAMFTLTDLVWQFTTSGLSTSWCMMLVTALGLMVTEALRAEDREEDSWTPVLWMVASAIVAGLLILTRYSFIPILLPLGLLIGFGLKRKVIILPVFFGIVCLLTGWWWVRNIQIIGNPLGLTWISFLVNSGNFPGDTLWRSLDLENGTFGLRPLMRALILGASGQMLTLSNLCGGFLILGLAVGSVFHTFRSFAASRSSWFWMAAFVLVFLAAAPSFRGQDPDTWNENNQVAPFIPVFLCFGSAFLLVLLDRIQFPLHLLKVLAVIVICLIQAIPIGLKIAGSTSKFPYPPYFPPLLILTSNWINEDEVQMSDIPWASAWYQGRSTIWLPMKQDDFFSINDQIHLVSMLLLTPYSQNARLFSEINQGEYKGWAGMVSRTDFSKTPLPFQVPFPWPSKERSDYYFFADHQRSGMTN